jgi:hypothetical protein
MKRMLMATTVTFCVLLIASFQNKVSAQPRTDISISYQTFYDELDPYGRWVDYPDHGYVWIPDAGPDFYPYSTRGRWVWSDDYEWMWVSDYDWGWAPFHYGRWMHDPFYGWIWVPGYEWSPAWVAWRHGGDYYGWAPLRPGFNISIGINLGGYNPPMDYWCFAPRRYITHHNIYNYCAPRRNNVTIINNTTIINNYNYNRNVFRTGPGRRDAERYAGRINPVRFRESSRPGRTSFRNNEVSIYRPNVQRDNNRSIAPRRLESFDRNRSNNNGNNNGNAIRRENRNNLPERRENGGFNRPERNANAERRNNDNSIAERNRLFERQKERAAQERNNRQLDRPQTPQRNERAENNNRETRPSRNFDRPRNQNQANERRIERRNDVQRNDNPSRLERSRQFGFDRQQRQEQPRREQPRMEQPRRESRQFEQRSSGGNGGSRNEDRGNRGGGGGFGRGKNR